MPARRLVKRLTGLLVVALLVLSGCALLGENTMYERSFDDGNLPFYQRTDVETAHTGLTSALQRVRNRIDAEYGPQNWTDIETLDEVGFGYCEDGADKGKYDLRTQGRAFGLPIEDFPHLRDIVIEELEPLGFTEVVDISEEKRGFVNIFNTEDGGYVTVMTSTSGKTLSLSYTTGCRPETSDSSTSPSH
ncbi:MULTISPECIES: LppA family lipoprotein [unclassified Actinobaculum]|uniref:LppA family lipoprotein n=1 Tax=unclassified Actinobaculum TaxID=2609299 RepID=UPI000D529BA0|nr:MULTISPECIES: LppA family lipoprotein [unclassified Actinobaculum]AWE41697.1 hypothetical protein DDD63_01760 [Actinobaculum sp. 313]RTE49319.1 DUF4853 domain-containing protein [Actinobaculum sp. 352]